MDNVDLPLKGGVVYSNNYSEICFIPIIIKILKNITSNIILLYIVEFMTWGGKLVIIKSKSLYYTHKQKCYLNKLIKYYKTWAPGRVKKVYDVS